MNQHIPSFSKLGLSKPSLGRVGSSSAAFARGSGLSCERSIATRDSDQKKGSNFKTPPDSSSEGLKVWNFFLAYDCAPCSLRLTHASNLVKSGFGLTRRRFIFAQCQMTRQAMRPDPNALLEPKPQDDAEAEALVAALTARQVACA